MGKTLDGLESHGLPGLQMLVEEIKAASDTSNRSPIEINIMKDTVQFSSQGYSAFNFAQSALDFAENGKSVNIENAGFLPYIRRNGEAEASFLWLPCAMDKR